MLIISEQATISPHADIEDSVRGTKIIIEAGVMIDSFVKIKPAGGSGDVIIGEGSYINSGTGCRAGQQHQSARLPQHALDLLENVQGNSKSSNSFVAAPSNSRSTIFFARNGGVGRHGRMSLRSQGRLFNPPILRQTILIGFKAGEEFDAAKDPFGNIRGQLAHFCHHAVEPESDSRGGPIHLQMDVAGLRRFGFCHHL